MPQSLCIVDLSRHGTRSKPSLANTVPSLAGVSVNTIKGTWPVTAASKAVLIHGEALPFEEDRRGSDRYHQCGFSVKIRVGMVEDRPAKRGEGGGGIMGHVWPLGLGWAGEAKKMVGVRLPRAGP